MSNFMMTLVSRIECFKITTNISMLMHLFFKGAQ